jgi:hypothetical protein
MFSDILSNWLTRLIRDRLVVVRIILKLVLSIWPFVLDLLPNKLLRGH